MTTRRLAAILAADVASYSRLISSDEADVLARWAQTRAMAYLCVLEAP